MRISIYGYSANTELYTGLGRNAHDRLCSDVSRNATFLEKSKQRVSRCMVDQASPKTAVNINIFAKSNHCEDGTVCTKGLIGQIVTGDNAGGNYVINCKM